VRNFNYNKFNHYEQLKNKYDLDAFGNPNANNNDNNYEHKIPEEINTLNAEKRFDIDYLEKQKFTGKDKNYFKKISEIQKEKNFAEEKNHKKLKKKDKIIKTKNT
jgi:hypothetical protein